MGKSKMVGVNSGGINVHSVYRTRPLAGKARGEGSAGGQHPGMIPHPQPEKETKVC